MESINKNNTKLSGGSNMLAKWFVLGFIVIIAFTQLFDVNISIKPRFGSGANKQTNASSISLETILPSDGVVLPVKWGDLGKRMVEAGVIDQDKFESVYAQRGGLDEYAKKLLYNENNGNLKINEQNSRLLLNLLWAFGLSNKNSILEEGPMMNEQYGGAGNFASTGGWTLAKGDAMNYYSKYKFIKLTEAQQELVERTSKNIFRPCCGNSTHFPDCNHGMAMLGLLQLLASQGASEKEMYDAALQVNSYWFPDTYLTIAKYFEKRGTDWDELNPKEILGSAYSSASGFRQILAEVQPVQSSGGGGCGI